MLRPLYSHYTLLHVSALEEPSLRSTDTFCEQGQQNTSAVTTVGLRSSTLCYVTVVDIFQYSTLAFDVNYEIPGAEGDRMESPGSAFS